MHLELVWHFIVFCSPESCVGLIRNTLTHILFLFPPHGRGRVSMQQRMHAYLRFTLVLFLYSSSTKISLKSMVLKVQGKNQKRKPLFSVAIVLERLFEPWLIQRSASKLPTYKACIICSITFSQKRKAECRKPGPSPNDARSSVVLTPHCSSAYPGGLVKTHIAGPRPTSS